MLGRARTDGMSEAPPSPALAEATEHQPSARVALEAALAAPHHAYLFVGPSGTGKRAAARAFAAEILAAGAADPDDTRRRVLAEPSPHPDLVWLSPPGTQHLVEEVRERVIRGAAYRPFEAARRAFVIEAADTMADESQNALLKTLEEPPPFAHLVLLSSEPALLLETVVSRCQPVPFAALSPEAVEERLAASAAGGSDGERRAAARLCGGDGDRALFLLTDAGRDLRARAEACARAARADRLDDSPWLGLLDAAERAGAEAASEASERVAERERTLRGDRARRREADDAGRRAGRRRRTEVLDLGLALSGAWFRDLAALGEGAGEVAINADRGEELRADAEGLDPRAARRAAELALDTRRRLRVNVSEELALEALFYRAAAELS
jgi:DNA polymerase-3 subunit delta'